ncbi:PAS domain S-box protein [Nostoc sp. FACHB-110]|uniref:PAS domain S-box protein n=1 Tax=Nostoc sp. FACHB-110 TaxID=2692834 RepID=UPI001684E072|nr:PAS domain S-box protein [Nostoc sp. FACHB-110]MBD2436937.1 PAS domain S-box protein [Nostoc sp. FACHB-110]
MKYEVVEQIFNKYSTLRKFEHLEIDRNFCLLDKSQQAHCLAFLPEEVKVGRDIRVGFPELAGLEDVLQSILQGQQETFELTEIKRDFEHQNTIYINIYITREISENIDDAKLIIFLEDVTHIITNNQNISKLTNAASILSMTLVAYKNYMDTVIHSMADALLVTSNSGKIKRVNPAAQKLFNFTEAELINQPISLIFDDNFLLLRILNHYSKINRDLQNFEVVCRKKTGEKVLIAFSCAVMQKKNEILEDIIYIGRDITGRQSREQRINAQYAITRILSESQNIKQAMPQILQAICQSLEWDVGELWTTNQYISTHAPEDNENAVLRCVEIYSSRLVSVREFKAVTWQTTYQSGIGLPGQIWSKNSPLWIQNLSDYEDSQRQSTARVAGLRSAFGFPILDDNKILGVMTFFSRDLQPKDTDLLQMMGSVGNQISQFMKRKQAEEDLLESEYRYRDICENANDLIQSVNPYGKFLYVNKAWCKTLGYTDNEVAKLNIFDIIHPDFKEHCRQMFYRLMSGEQLENVQTAFIGKNGQTVFLEGNVNCKFVHGKPVATRGIFRNITQKVEIEAALQHQQEKTEKLWQTKIPAFVTDTLQPEIASAAADEINITVLCADIVGLNEIVTLSSAMQMVNLLSPIFAAFDRLCTQYGLEKVQTINEAYVVIGGLPKKRQDHTQAIARMALDMQAAIAKFNQENQQNLKLCIGIHTGTITAAANGLMDTINIARSVEGQSLADTIQVTSSAYAQIRDEFVLEKQDEIVISNQQKITTYLLQGKSKK